MLSRKETSATTTTVVCVHVSFYWLLPLDFLLINTKLVRLFLFFSSKRLLFCFVLFCSFCSSVKDIWVFRFVFAFLLFRITNTTERKFKKLNWKKQRRVGQTKTFSSTCVFSLCVKEKKEKTEILSLFFYFRFFSLSFLLFFFLFLLFSLRHFLCQRKQKWQRKARRPHHHRRQPVLKVQLVLDVSFVQCVRKSIDLVLVFVITNANDIVVSLSNSISFLSRDLRKYLRHLFFMFSAGEGLVEATALHRVKCQEPACTYQMLAISDLRNHLSNHHQKTEYKCTEERRFNSIAGREKQ